jgi:hypothetical protein
MAIYHLSVKPISRKDGRSATAATAYRAGERIHDLTTEQVFDYTRKRGVEHGEIVLYPLLHGDSDQRRQSGPGSQPDGLHLAVRELRDAVPREIQTQ